MFRFAIGVMAAVFALGPAALRGEDEARAVVEKAIAAQGGKDQVAKLTKAWKAKVRGIRDGNAMSGETYWDPPDRFKADLRIEVASGKTTRVVAVLNGEKGWQSVDGEIHEIPGGALSELRDLQFRGRKIRSLLPLLTDGEFTLSPLGKKQVGGRSSAGVRVGSEDGLELDLFFDTETGLLVKKEQRRADSTGRESLVETFYSNYKDFGGLRLATVIAKHADGQLQSTQELLEISFVERIDPGEFTKP